jgi:hypothetical protein
MSLPKTVQNDEEFFMISSWIDHVPVLEYHRRVRDDPQRG